MMNTAHVRYAIHHTLPCAAATHDKQLAQIPVPYYYSIPTRRAMKPTTSPMAMMNMPTELMMRPTTW